MPAIIIPFIPFGIWELRVPIAWSVNYLIERFNGIDDGQLTPGRNYQGRKFANQQGCLIDGIDLNTVFFLIFPVFSVLL